MCSRTDTPVSASGLPTLDREMVYSHATAVHSVAETLSVHSARPIAGIHDNQMDTPTTDCHPSDLAYQGDIAQTSLDEGHNTR